MAYQATVVPIMIASPGDVYEEREVARDVIHTWNYINSMASGAVLLPVGWETHSSPELGARAQELINERVLKNCDLLVGIFWTRIGTPTGEAVSGTVEEIEKHIAVGKPAMLYFSSKPVAPQSFKPQQYQTLTEFKEHCLDRGLVEEFDNLPDFKDKFARQLQICLHENSHMKTLLSAVASAKIAPPDTGVSPGVPGARLSDEAKILIKEASKDPSGTILKIAVVAGRFIQTNGKSFGGDRGRESARWENALSQLVVEGYVEKGLKGQVFKVTHEGYALADQLPDVVES